MSSVSARAPARNSPEVEAAFEAVPPEMVAELLDGELFAIPRPARPQTLEAYRLEGAHWLLLATYEGGAKVRVEPFEAIELDLGQIWAA